MSRDCFFFIDPERKVPEEERTLSILCVDCREEFYPDTGWFWSADNGYGPWDYKCCKCNSIIHKGKQEDYEETKTAN